MCGTEACYLRGLCILQTVRRHGLEHPTVNYGSPGNRVCEDLEVCPQDLPRVLGEDCVSLAQGEYGRDYVSRDYVSFGFNTKPLQTRCTTVTAVGTGSSTTVFTEKRVLIPQLFIFPYYVLMTFTVTV